MLLTANPHQPVDGVSDVGGAAAGSGLSVRLKEPVASLNGLSQMLQLNIVLYGEESGQW